MRDMCFNCGGSLDTGMRCALRCADKKSLEEVNFVLNKKSVWMNDSYMRLGACRDNMTPREVSTVQKFIEGGYNG